MSIFFISDLHLSESRPKTTALFLKFLKEEAKGADALYILGDFFEVWLGDDTIEQNGHNYQVVQALAEYRDSGVPLYFMQGNRDFLIGKRFAKMANLILLLDPCVIELYGQRTVLTHGDLLCTLDTGYQWFRKLSRPTIAQQLFLSFPLSLRQNLAQKIRAKSRRQFVPNYNSVKFDVTLDAVQALLRKCNADLLIHGHTHIPGIHQFNLDHHSAKRIVLGEWQEKATILKASATSLDLMEISI